MEVKLTCPLGSECEKAVDGRIERCAWYTRMVGKDPQTDADIDDWRCAIVWQPIVMIEASAQSRATTKSIQQMSNQIDKRQKQAIREVSKSVQISTDS